MDSLYFDPATVPWTDLGDGIRRKVVAHTPQLMSVLVQFDQGAVGTPHAHERHDQIAFCLSGSFECDIGGQRRVIRAGEAFVAPHGTLHGVKALEPDSTILDQFAPRRDDYL